MAIPLAAGLIVKGATKARGLASALKFGGRAIKRAISGKGTAAAAGAGAGVAVGTAIERSPGPPPPGLPMGFQQQQPPALPGMGARIARVLPGGRSGYAWEADPQYALDKWKRPVAVTIGYISKAHCPRGYVAVDHDNDGVADTCMLKGAARAMGLWRPRPKPVVSATDTRAIRRAARAQARVQKLAKDVGLRKMAPAAGKGRFPKKKAKR